MRPPTSAGQDAEDRHAAGQPRHAGRHDYWSMRRYLNEFLSDKRVVDLPDWKWQPMLQLIILTKRPFKSGANYKLIWNTRAQRKPAADHHQRDRPQPLREALADALRRQGHGRFLHALRQSRRPSRRCRRWSRRAAKRSCSSRCTRTTPGRPRPPPMTRSLPPLMQGKAPACRADRGRIFRPSALYRRAGRDRSRRAYAALDHVPDVLVASYHGMPKRYLMEGDPYHCQCAKTRGCCANGWAGSEGGST